MVITTRDTFGVRRTYEVVEKIPVRYFVWNIGANMGSDEYIPLAERLYPGADVSDPQYYHVNPDTIKAIRMEKAEVKLLRKAAGYSVSDVASAKKIIAGELGWQGEKGLELRKIAEKVLPILEKYSM